jgi:methyl-accepting chemotaxis protein
MKNWKIRSQLGLLSVITASMIIIVGLIGLTGMSDVVGRLRTVYEDRTVCLVQLGKIARWHRGDVQRLKLAALYASQGNAAGVAAEIDVLRQDEAAIDEQWKAYSATYLTEDEQILANAYQAHMAAFRQQELSPVLDTPPGQALPASAAARIDDESASAGALVMKDLEDLTDLQDRVAASEFKRSQTDYAIARLIAITVILVALGAGLALSAFIRRNLLRQLGCEPQRLKQISLAIAHGDISQNIDLGSAPADSVQGSMLTMQRYLNQLIGNIVASVNLMASALRQISATADQVGDAATQQSHAANTMAAAVEEMLTAISHISDNAAQSRDLSSTAGELASTGASVVQQSAHEMASLHQTVVQTSSEITQLSQQTEQISAILQVISDIADQTNLLALNAAIEAARAGETGRGFAVVADEVRKLAERTNKATAEISTMISAIQQAASRAVDSMENALKKAEGGAQLAHKAGETIVEIRSSSSEVMKTVNDISLSLTEQNQASSLLGGTVEQIARMSEQNSLALRQMLGALSDLERLSHTLHLESQRFTL